MNKNVNDNVDRFLELLKNKTNDVNENEFKYKEIQENSPWKIYNDNDGENSVQLLDSEERKFIKTKLLEFTILERSRSLKKIDAWQRYLEKSKINFFNRYNNQHAMIAEPFEFNHLKIIGNGEYGDVVMSLKTNNGYFYATKIFSKVLLLKKGRVARAKNEKLILNSIRFPFTINLEYFYETKLHLFYVLPLALGKDLFFLLTKSKQFKENIVKFYSAQIIIALEYLHYLGLVYRDLKPENILIDHNGYLKLADFGLCKLITNRTYTFCGTPEYTAPEVILSRGYGQSVDYWAIGILLYELCSGKSPFYANNDSHIFEKILKSQYKIPYYFTHDLKDLLQNLITPDLTKRYGSIKNGITTLKWHKWFHNVNWYAILNRTEKPPYLPNLSFSTDLIKLELSEIEDDEVVDLLKPIFENF